MPADDALRADLGELTVRLEGRLARLEVAVARLSEQLLWMRANLERASMTTASPGADAEAA